MKYAVCILAHKDPVLLARIVKKLTADNVKIYIHLDKKSDINAFTKCVNARFIKERENVYWGGRSIVKAMYNLIYNVVLDNECDYILFISGQDYPLVLTEKYDSVIDKNKNYIEYYNFPRADWYNGGLDRIRYYYLLENNRNFIYKASIKIQKLLKVNRKLRNDFKIYCGSQWINININTAKEIINSFEYYYKYFKLTHIPDEMMFQTIIMNSSQKEFVVNDNLRYIRFINKLPNPIILNETHFSDIISSNALFFRKVENNSLLDRIDQHRNNI